MRLSMKFEPLSSTYIILLEGGSNRKHQILLLN